MTINKYKQVPLMHIKNKKLKCNTKGCTKHKFNRLKRVEAAIKHGFLLTQIGVGSQTANDTLADMWSMPYQPKLIHQKIKQLRKAAKAVYRKTRIHYPLIKAFTKEDVHLTPTQVCAKYNFEKSDSVRTILCRLRAAVTA